MLLLGLPYALSISVIVGFLAIIPIIGTIISALLGLILIGLAAKINQLRHVRYFKNLEGVKAHMMKHAAQMRPKFEATLKVLKEELTGLGIGTWSEPRGGYFISFDAMEGCAKAIVAKCKDAGVVLTNASITLVSQAQ